MEDTIDLFLDTVRLTKYRDKFRDDGVCPVREVSGFRQFLSNQEALRGQVGMSALEAKRFVRLCDSTIQVQSLTVALLILLHCTVYVYVGVNTASCPACAYC